MKIFIYIFFLFLGTLSTRAQDIAMQVIGSTGSDHSFHAGSLSFTLGESSTLSLESENYYLLQGFHQDLIFAGNTSL